MVNHHQKLRISLVINDDPQPQVIVDFIQKSMNAEHYFIEKILVKKCSSAQCNVSLKKKIEQKIIPKTKIVLAVSFKLRLIMSKILYVITRPFHILES